MIMSGCNGRRLAGSGDGPIAGSYGSSESRSTCQVGQCCAVSSQLTQNGAVSIIEPDYSVDSKRPAATALVLSGPPGVGKTTVGWRVFDLCTDAGDDPALVDLDMMGAAWPAPEDDPNQSRSRARNLAAVWANYQAVGSQRLIMAGVVESETDRESLSTAVGAPVIVCMLLASPVALESRVRGRGRDHGPGLDKLISRAAMLSVQLANADVTGFAVDTDGQSVDEIADEVLQRWNLIGYAHAR